MQLLADKHDYGGLFTHIKRKSIVKGASGSVNAAPSLEAFYEHFGYCYLIQQLILRT